MYSIKQVRGEGRNNIKGLLSGIEDVAYQSITGNYPDYWENDIISLSLIRGMITLINQKKIRVPGNVLQSHWSPYILNNDIEKRIGDIAFLIKTTFHDGHTTEGVAVLETALKDKAKNTFSSIKKDQTRKLNNTFPHSQVLLCDYDHITGMAFPTVPESIIGNYPHSWNSWVPFTQAAVIQSGLCYELGIKTTGLYKACLPFSYQLSYRYLYGVDLDFSKNALDIARGIKTTKGCIKYLICVSVAHGDSEPQKHFDFNREIYSKLE